MPNPGRMAIGAVLTCPNGEDYYLAQALPGVGCNNEAELRALKAGLEVAQQQGASSIRIYTDSRWLLEQLAPAAERAGTVRPTLRLGHWLVQVREVLQPFEQVQWRWIPRHHNTEADALARQACLALHAA